MNWWESKENKQPLLCVYCGKLTSDSEDAEHIIPEALGCKETLYCGAVCTDCNHRLGINVDSKVCKESMFAAGQVATDTPGKNGLRNQIGN